MFEKKCIVGMTHVFSYKWQDSCLEKILAAMELCSLYMFTFQQSLTHVWWYISATR